MGTAITQNEEWLADLSANWTTLAPIIFFYEPNDTVSQILREFYFGSNDKPLTNESLTGLSKVSLKTVLTAKPTTKAIAHV